MEKIVLVTGGAGYIGSTTTKLLQQHDYKTITLDNLSSGTKGLNKSDFFYEGSISNEKILEKIFSTFKITAVLHFAASSLVEESVQNPKKYYENNLVGTIKLLEKMLEFNVKKIIFSSSASVYGKPKKIPITEKTKTKPLNPYGRTKFFIEEILKDYHKAYGLNSISLRYFNASGTEKDLEVGEVHTPETHLIPLLVRAALENKPISINGRDYETYDGTCIRDYIHVSDLANAHLKALNYLEKQEACLRINLANEQGFSILEIIQALEKILGKKIQIKNFPRRPGDPAILIGRNETAEKILDWKTQITNIEEIIKTAYRWQCSNRFKELTALIDKNPSISSSILKKNQTEQQEFS